MRSATPGAYQVTHGLVTTSDGLGDEELARILQRQEQIVEGVDSNLSAQEREDRDLTRRLLDADLPQRILRQQFPPEQERNDVDPHRVHSPLSTQQRFTSQETIPELGNAMNNLQPYLSDRESAIAYAQELQRGAFSSLGARNDREGDTDFQMAQLISHLETGHEGVGESDLQIAQRMQEIENRQGQAMAQRMHAMSRQEESTLTNNVPMNEQEQDDFYLAQFLEKSGMSMSEMVLDPKLKEFQAETGMTMGELQESSWAAAAFSTDRKPAAQNLSSNQQNESEISADELRLLNQNGEANASVDSVLQLPLASKTAPFNDETTIDDNNSSSVGLSNNTSEGILVAACAPLQRSSTLNGTSSHSKERRKKNMIRSGSMDSYPVENFKEIQDSSENVPEIPAPVKSKKKGKFNFFAFKGRLNQNNDTNLSNNRIPSPIPDPTSIPRVPEGIPDPIPGPGPRDSFNGLTAQCTPLTHQIVNPSQTTGTFALPQSNRIVCSGCGGRGGKFVIAMDKKFHIDCFRCMSCNDLIDPTSVFALTLDHFGNKQPIHRHCFADIFGIKCVVCKQTIPAAEDGTIEFVKHPFFDAEQMCPHHEINPGRRCTGCHRFEPDGEKFADLNDAERCVCYACCRTVIMDNESVMPIWDRVLAFFERMNLPVWNTMRNIPVLVVGQDALTDNLSSIHGESNQMTTRGVCLSEYECGKSFRSPSLRFNEDSSSFEALDTEESGYSFFTLPRPSTVNPASSVTAILCLSGLPKDLTASVLAHEATHAWIKLHPDFRLRKSLPPQVEEGCAQLIAFLFLNEGLEDADISDDGQGPTDEKLRQYFKFSIETSEDEIYGEGFRKAAAAYSSIGIEALMNHVVSYRNFPSI